MSQKKRQEVYAAIHEEVVDLRLKLQREHNLTADIDHKIAQVEHRIWRSVKRALGLDEGDS